MQSIEKQKIISGRIKDVIIIGALGIVLCVAIWLMSSDGRVVANTTVNYSQTESKLIALLEEIDGVGNAEVMVCETKEGIVGAVIVCEGANDLKVNLYIREAVATALGTQQNNVKIYLKK
jgi:hypothetical protein